MANTKQLRRKEQAIERLMGLYYLYHDRYTEVRTKYEEQLAIWKTIHKGAGGKLASSAFMFGDCDFLYMSTPEEAIMALDSLSPARLFRIDKSLNDVEVKRWIRNLSAKVADLHYSNRHDKKICPFGSDPASCGCGRHSWAGNSRADD